MPNGSLIINPIVGIGSGIEDIELATINRQPSDIYDLQGRKITTPQAGRVYIQDGKKIIWR
jgi:hypothetical protein